MTHVPSISSGSFLYGPSVADNLSLLPNGSYPFNASLFYGFPSGNLNWTTPRADLGILTYDPSKTNMWAVGKTVDQLFRPNVFSYEQICVYAISSQYGFLPRLLYYLLLISSLVLRKHSWLSTAALGAAMTYAATASVHAFALLFRYKYHTPSIANSDWIYLPPKELGDIDLQAIFPILVAGSIMLTPILSFSTTVRENKSSSVVIVWGLLLFGAMIPTFVIAFKGFVPSVAVSQVSTCALDASRNCTFENLYMIHKGISLNSYNKCNCSNTCGALNWPHSPLRHNQGASALLISDLISDTVGLLTGSKLFRPIWLVNCGFVMWIIAQGIIGLIELGLTETKRNQAAVRNWVFSKLAGTTPKKQRTTLGSRLRYYIGKSIAGFYFLAVIAVAFISPFVFVSSVIINEFVTWDWPVGESYDAVGQWSTWASVAFVIIAAVIQEYHGVWWISVKRSCATVVHVMKWICGKDRFRDRPQEVRTKENSVVEDTKSFFEQCARPFVHTWKGIREILGELSGDWSEFKKWHNDPVGVSTRDSTLCAPSNDGYVDVEVHPTSSTKDQSSLNQRYKHVRKDLATYNRPFRPTILPLEDHCTEPIIPPQAAWACATQGPRQK